jgi:hypothetical protein
MVTIGMKTPYIRLLLAVVVISLIFVGLFLWLPEKNNQKDKQNTTLNETQNTVGNDDQNSSYGEVYDKRDGVIYCYGEPIQADAGSFSVLHDAGGYAKDKDNAYYFGDIISGADPNTLELLDAENAKDQDNVYYAGVKISGADPASYVVYGRNWSKDNESVYKAGKRLEGADPATFEFFLSNTYDQPGISDYSKDKNYVYYEDTLSSEVKKLENSDGPTFAFIDIDYAKDKNNVYKKGKIIQGADPKTTNVVRVTIPREGFYKDNTPDVFVYLTDAKSVYYNGAKLEGSDGATF